MNAEQSQTKPGQSLEDSANDTATDLLLRAIAEVSGFTPPRLNDYPEEAIIGAAHAIIAKLDAMETTHLEVMRDLQESLDCLGARSDENKPALTPTSHESEVMYRALEDDYLRSHQAANIDEMDATLRRFKQLSGC